MKRILYKYGGASRDQLDMHWYMRETENQEEWLSNPVEPRFLLGCLQFSQLVIQTVLFRVKNSGIISGQSVSNDDLIINGMIRSQSV